MEAPPAATLGRQRTSEGGIDLSGRREGCGVYWSHVGVGGRESREQGELCACEAGGRSRRPRTCSND